MKQPQSLVKKAMSDMVRVRNIKIKPSVQAKKVMPELKGPKK